MRIILRQIVRHPRQAGMHIAPAKIFSCHFLAGRSLHQGRASQENRALIAHNDGHIRHCRHIRPTGRARSHHHRDLGDAAGTHLRLIVKDPAEVIAVWEHLILVRKVRAAAVDQVNARQVTLLRNLLCAQMFFDRHWVIRAAFDGRIVAQDHTIRAGHAPHPRDDTRRRRRIVVKPMRCSGANLKKRAARVQQCTNPVAREHLATGHMPRARCLSSAGCGRLYGLLDHPQSLQMRAAVGLKIF